MTDIPLAVVYEALRPYLEDDNAEDDPVMPPAKAVNAALHEFMSAEQRLANAALRELEKARSINERIAHVHGPKPWPHQHPGEHDVSCVFDNPHPELCCAECSDTTVHAWPCKTRRIADGSA